MTVSVRRLLLTSAAMAAVAAALAALTPALPVLTDALTHPQRTADREGSDALVLAAAGLLAWLFWAWGATGLALTAVSAAPGLLGAAARTALAAVLPAGTRRSAALLLGISLGMAGPLLGAAVPSLPAAAAAPDGVPDWPLARFTDQAPTSQATVAVPDWPSDTPPDGPSDTPPDGPPARAPGPHVVVRGDCLWSIAEARLLQESGRAPSAGEVSRSVQAWWVANHAVIGPDPDHLQPGQILRPPVPS
jgi:nucleoid-associated protein YgaU